MSTNVQELAESLYDNIPCQKISSSLYLYQTNLHRLNLLLSQACLPDLLSQAETERLHNTSNPRVKKQFIAGRFLIRIVLARHSGIPASAVHIHTNEHGKPFQSNKEGVSFNLSHTGDFFALVVSHEGEVGVDIERHKKRKSLIAMADEVLTPNELHVFRQLTTDDQLSHFYRLWTLKEATLKAEGTGFAIPANSIGFTQDLELTDWNESLGDSQQWRWWYQCDSSLSCAVALNHNG